MRIFPISHIWSAWRGASNAERLLTVYSIGVTIILLRRREEPEERAPLWPTLPPPTVLPAAAAAPAPVNLEGLTEKEEAVMAEGRHRQLTRLTEREFAARSAEIEQLFDVRDLLMTERRDQFQGQLVGMMTDLFGLFSNNSAPLIREFEQLYGGVLRSSQEAVQLAYLFKQLGIDQMPEEDPSDFTATLYVLMPLIFDLLEEGADPSDLLECAGHRIEESQRRSREAMGTTDSEAVPLNALVEKLVGLIGGIPKVVLFALRTWMTLPWKGLRSLIIKVNTQKLERSMVILGPKLGEMGKPIPEAIAWVRDLTPEQAHYKVTQNFLERDKNTMKVSVLWLRALEEHVDGASFQAIWTRRERILAATQSILATHEGYNDPTIVETVQAVMAAQRSEGAFARFIQATRATYIWLYIERPVDMVEVIERFRYELNLSSSR
jgi:hypothetical protein